MEAESAVAKGWLIKKAGILKSRCWFWLVEDKLMYSKTVPASDGSAKFHAIDLSLAHQVRKTDSPFSFEIVSRKEHFVLIAATQAECDDWVKTLQVAMQSHKRSSQVWRSSVSSDDTLHSSATGCAATVAGLNQSTSDVREDNAPAEQLFQSPSPHENDIDRAASCGATDGMSVAPTNVVDVGKASDSCHVLANYPTAVDLAAHLARKKTLLHRYEDINSPEAERAEIGSAAADVACEPSDKRHDRHSKRISTTTHELVVLEAKKNERTANGRDPPKRFSIHTELKAETRPRDSFVGSDVRMKGTKNPIGSSSYEEIILEDEITTSNGDPQKRLSVHAGLKAENIPRAFFVASDVRLKSVTNPNESGLYEEIVFEALPPNTTDAGDFDSSALYSKIQRQPRTANTSTDDVTSSDVQSVMVSHSWSEQPRPIPQFNQRPQDEQQQQVQAQGGCGLAGITSTPLGLEEQPPSLPLPRPAVRIVETDDDFYAKLKCGYKSSAEDSSCAAAANEQQRSKTTLSAILADELAASDEPCVKAYRPQPYSHAVSLLKEHLVREGAFGVTLLSHRL